MLREWGGIDHLRLDKYLSLIRKVFRELIIVMTSSDFDDDHIDGCVTACRSSSAASCGPWYARK
jgi:hypothetical protein